MPNDYLVREGSADSFNADEHQAKYGWTMTTTDTIGDLFATTQAYMDPYPSENACCGDGEAKQAEPYNQYKYDEMRMFENILVALINKGNSDAVYCALQSAEAVRIARTI